MSILRSLTFAALAFVCVASTRASIILSEDFEKTYAGVDSTVGAAYTSTTSNIFKPTVSAGTGNTLTYTDDATAGITFSGSRFLNYADVGSGGPQLRSTFTAAPLSQAALTGAWTVSFDFYEPNAVIAGTATHFRVVMGAGDLGLTTTRTVDLLFAAANDGAALTGTVNNWDALPAVVSYSTNALHHFDLVGNHSGSAISYGGGTIGDQKYDLYMDGVLVLDEMAYRNPISSVTDFGMGYSSSASRVDRVFVDNIVVQDTAAVPEPASIVTLLLAGLALAAYRRRVR
ncbi:MAG: PEP-CTERM sorting domain-containing protein [Pirellulales bacterium]|nr:PEP-CTERM sorting domain-containing protein [Pirellulales bacterium]